MREKQAEKEGKKEVSVMGKREDFLLQRGRRESEKEVRKTRNKRKGKRERDKGTREIYKVGFWNVANMEHKDEEFWERLKEWDVMFL